MTELAEQKYHWRLCLSWESHSWECITHQTISWYSHWQTGSSDSMTTTHAQTQQLLQVLQTSNTYDSIMTKLCEEFQLCQVVNAVFSFDKRLTVVQQTSKIKIPVNSNKFATGNFVIIEMVTLVILPISVTSICFGITLISTLLCWISFAHSSTWDLIVPIYSSPTSKIQQIYSTIQQMICNIIQSAA